MTKQLPLLMLIISLLSVNSLAFFYYRKMKNIYISAFIILMSAVALAIVVGCIAITILGAYVGYMVGLMVGLYLLINSLIVFLVAVVVSIIKFSKHM